MGKERPKWEEGKPQTGGRETHAAWEEESKCETNISTSMTEIQLNKYERNPIGKYCCVKSPNWGKKRPKLGEGRKAAPQPHPVNLREVGQWESASSRVEKANSVRSCPLSMKIFVTICHGRKIPRSQALRSPNSQPCELGNLTRYSLALGWAFFLWKVCDEKRLTLYSAH